MAVFTSKELSWCSYSPTRCSRGRTTPNTIYNSKTFASMAYLIIVWMTQAALVKVWFWLRNSEHSLLLVAQLSFNLSCTPYPFAHLTSIDMPAELYGIDLTQCNFAAVLRRHKAQFNRHKSLMALFTPIYLSPSIFFCLLLDSLLTASIGHFLPVNLDLLSCSPNPATAASPKLH